MPNTARISPARPMNICTAPAYLGAGFEGGLTGESLVDVVAVADAAALRRGVFVAADGPEGVVGMALYRLTQQPTIGLQRVEIEEKERPFALRSQRPSIILKGRQQDSQDRRCLCL
jgi:hypothetical protein